MADLKAGTTVGGQLVWTQGNFPLYPTGNTLLYKTFKIYSENDKPQASDNDFVSKASGGQYGGTVGITGNLQILTSGTDGNGVSLYGSTLSSGEPSYGIFFGNTTVFGKHGSAAGDFATYFTNRSSNVYGWIFKSSAGAVASVGSTGIITAPSYVASNSAPTANNQLTRKDYVDGLINTTTTNANTRVLRAGDTMTGTLTAPNFISSNLATTDTQVPQLKQVVPKGVTLDYGTF